MWSACGNTPTYLTVAGTSAPAPISPSWWGRMFGCGVQPTYLPAPVPTVTVAPQPAPIASQPAPIASTNPTSPIAGRGGKGGGTIGLTSSTVLVMPDSVFELIIGSAKPITIVRSD